MDLVVRMVMKNRMDEKELVSKVKHSNWVNWKNWGTIEGINHSGIYIIAISDKTLSDKTFNWDKHIAYIGMTNSLSGLKGRLRQFDNTISGRRKSHSGADRIRYKHQNYDELIRKLYVSIVNFPCEVRSKKPEDLIVMGLVAKFEYDCFARYVEIYNRFPEFNDRDRSPRYSLTSY